MKNLSLTFSTVPFGLAKEGPRRSLRSTTALVVHVVAFAFVLPNTASAAEVRHGQFISVPASETVNNDLIVAAKTVEIDGTVEGDVIAFTGVLTVTGHVTGDVIAFAQQVRIAGPVDGNLRLFAQTAIIEGQVGKNVTSFAATLDLTSAAHIGGGMITLNREANLQGHIQRDLLGLIAHTYLGGAVGGQLWLRGGTLEVASTAAISGPAIFKGNQQPKISPQARLASPIQVQIIQRTRPRRRLITAWLVIHSIVAYGAALLVGILLLTIVPGFFYRMLFQANRIGLPIAIGALTLIIGAVVLVTGVFLLFAGVGAGVALAFALAPAMYISQVVVSAWFGRKILKSQPVTTGAMIGRIALGLLILDVVAAIPFLGGLVRLAVLLWGTGAVLMAFYQMSRSETPAALKQ